MKEQLNSHYITNEFNSHEQPLQVIFEYPIFWAQDMGLISEKCVVLQNSFKDRCRELFVPRS